MYYFTKTHTRRTRSLKLFSMGWNTISTFKTVLQNTVSQEVSQKGENVDTHHSPRIRTTRDLSKQALRELLVQDRHRVAPFPWGRPRAIQQPCPRVGALAPHRRLPAESPPAPSPRGTLTQRAPERAGQGPSRRRRGATRAAGLESRRRGAAGTAEGRSLRASGTGRAARAGKRRAGGMHWESQSGRQAPGGRRHRAQGCTGRPEAPSGRARPSCRPARQRLPALASARVRHAVNSTSRRG